MSVGAKIELIRLFLDGNHLDKCHSCLKVLEKTRRCSKCKTALYCSKECQAAHWHDKDGGHKNICSILEIGAKGKDGSPSKKKKKKTEEEEEEEIQEEARALVRHHNEERIRIQRERAVPYVEEEEEEDDLSDLSEEVVQALAERRALVKEAHVKRRAEADARALEELTLEDAQLMVRTRRRRVQEAEERFMVDDPIGRLVMEIFRHPDVLLRFAREASFADVARWSRVSRAWRMSFAGNQRFWYSFIITRPINNQLGEWNTFTNYRNIAFSRFATQGGWWAGWDFESNRRMVAEIVRLVSTNEESIQDIIEMYDPAEVMRLSITNRSFMTYFGQNPELWQSLLYDRLSGYQGDDIERIRRIAYTNGLPAQNYRATLLSMFSGYRIELSGNIYPVWDHPHPFRNRWIAVYGGTNEFHLDITWLDIYRRGTLLDVINDACPTSFRRAHTTRNNSEANYDLCEVMWYWADSDVDSNAGEFPWPDIRSVEVDMDDEGGRLIIDVEQKEWDATCLVTFPDELRPEYEMSIQTNSPLEITIYEADGFDWVSELSDQWPQIWFNQAGEPVLNESDWEVHVTITHPDRDRVTRVGFIIPGFMIFPQNLDVFRRMIQAHIDEVFDGGIDQDLVYSHDKASLIVNLEVRRK